MAYRARHLSRGDLVALKMLRPQSGDAVDSLENVAQLRRFKSEFRALPDINHRHHVGLHALEENGGQHFFTMDLIDGQDFFSFVRPGNQLDEARLRSAISQLFLGVTALHGRHTQLIMFIDDLQWATPTAPK